LGGEKVFFKGIKNTCFLGAMPQALKVSGFQPVAQHNNAGKA
jgi:hypothetical protein